MNLGWRTLKALQAGEIQLIQYTVYRYYITLYKLHFPQNYELKYCSYEQKYHKKQH